MKRLTVFLLVLFLVLALDRAIATDLFSLIQCEGSVQVRAYSRDRDQSAQFFGSPSSPVRTYPVMDGQNSRSLRDWHAMHKVENSVFVESDLAHEAVEHRADLMKVASMVADNLPVAYFFQQLPNGMAMPDFYCGDSALN